MAPNEDFDAGKYKSPAEMRRDPGQWATMTPPQRRDYIRHYGPQGGANEPGFPYQSVAASPDRPEAHKPDTVLLDEMLEAFKELDDPKFWVGEAFGAHETLWTGERFEAVLTRFPSIRAKLEALNRVRESKHLQNLQPKPPGTEGAKTAFQVGMEAAEAQKAALADLRTEIITQRDALEAVTPTAKIVGVTTESGDPGVQGEQGGRPEAAPGAGYADRVIANIDEGLALVARIKKQYGKEGEITLAPIRDHARNLQEWRGMVLKNRGATTAEELAVGADEDAYLIPDAVTSTLDTLALLTGESPPAGGSRAATAVFIDAYEKAFDRKTPSSRTERDALFNNPARLADMVMSSVDSARQFMAQVGIQDFDTGATIDDVFRVSAQHVYGGTQELIRQQYERYYGAGSSGSKGVEVAAQNALAGLTARIRDANDPMDADMARSVFGYVIETLRRLDGIEGTPSAEQLEKERALIDGFIGLSPDQAQDRADAIIRSRTDAIDMQTEKSTAAFERRQGLEAMEEGRTRYDREEQMGIRTDIRDMQQRQQEQTTGIHRAVAAAQQQMASEYLDQAPMFGPVTPGAKIGGANIYEQLAGSRGIVDPGYLEYGGAVPRMPQASDMQAFHEALASARAKLAYGTEDEALAGLPAYTPEPGVSAPGSIRR